MASVHIGQIIILSFTLHHFSYTLLSGNFEELNKWWIAYYAVVTSWGLFNLLVMVPVLKHVYHVPDPVIILACAVGSFLRCLVFVLGTQRGHLYIGGFLDLFQLSGLVTCRSSLATLVNRGEVGAIFAVVAVLQAVTDCLSHLCQMIFMDTMDWHAGFVYCLNAMFFLSLIHI